MFIFYFCLKQQDKHWIRHYDCDYDKKIRYKYGPLIFVYILQGKMGKTERKERKSRNLSDQNTENQKKKYGMNIMNKKLYVYDTFLDYWQWYATALQIKHYKLLIFLVQYGILKGDF